MKEAIIVDLEDTLSDTSHRKHLSPFAKRIKNPKSEDFDEWNEGLVNDPPTSLVPIIHKLSKKYEIIICTAKPVRYRIMVQNWLDKELGWVPDFIFMRGESCMNLSSPEFKKKILSHIKEVLKYKVVYAIDDRKDVCDIYTRHNINTWLYMKIHTMHIPSGVQRLLDDVNHMKDDIEKIDYSKPPTAGDILINAAKIFKAKGEEYGNSYHEFGDLCKALFPKGLELKTAEDMNRWAVLQLMLVKIQRYSNHFLSGGHKDSLDDLIVYTSMLQELDSIISDT